MKSITILKLIFSILLFLCLADMPYGYYQFIRLIGGLGFGYLAYEAFNKKSKLAYLYLLLALLFQPFIKISLGRELWNMVDVIVGIGLLLSIAIEKRK